MTSDIPPHLRRYIDLPPDKEDKITELVQLMQEAYDPLPDQLQSLLRYAPTPPDAPTPHNTIRHYCYCALISRGWDVQRAFRVMQKNTDYRRANHIDERSELPTSISMRGWDQMQVARALDKEPRETNQRIDQIVQSMGHYFPFGVHAFDRNGQPVFYVMLGRINEEMILKKLKQVANIGQAPDDVVWELMLHVIGIGEWLAYYQQMQYDAGKLKVDASEGLIRAVTVVIDMNGFGYSMIWKPALDLAIRMARRLFHYYPQCVHHILVVNAPSMVSFAYRVIHPMVPALIQEKVHIVGPDASLTLLTEYIDEECLPKFLGGTCCCPGRCLNDYDPDTESEPTDSKDHEYGGVMTDDVVLRAGAEYKKVVALQEKETVVWNFVSTSGYDVAFTTYFVPASQCTAVDMEKVDVRSLSAYVVSKANPSEGSSEYKASVDGVLVLVWDNKQSWLTRKYVQMKVYKQKAPTEEVM